MGLGARNRYKEKILWDCNSAKIQISFINAKYKKTLKTRFVLFNHQALLYAISKDYYLHSP